MKKSHLGDILELSRYQFKMRKWLILNVTEIQMMNGHFGERDKNSWMI